MALPGSVTVARHLLVCACIGAATAPALAQGGDDRAPTTAVAVEQQLPRATFALMFRKYTAPRTPFSPYHSWDVSMRLRLVLWRMGAGAVTFTNEVQSVGTENFGSRVSVGGVGYLIDIGYVHAWSSDVRLSAGIAHLSSHLTRDLDEKRAEERARGADVPVVDDPDEYNVVFVSWRRQFPARPLSPTIEVVLHPVNVRLRGGRGAPVRPLSVRAAFALWNRDRLRLSAETLHEVGPHPVQHYALVLGLRPDRHWVDVFLSGSPGRGFHVSPMSGALRDGIALGVRLRFDVD